MLEGLEELKQSPVKTLVPAMALGEREKDTGTVLRVPDGQSENLDSGATLPLTCCVH